jgi:hypothetical protein
MIQGMNAPKPHEVDLHAAGDIATYRWRCPGTAAKVGAFEAPSMGDLRGRGRTARTWQLNTGAAAMRSN